MTCERESKQGNRKDHIKECLQCQCIVCTDWLLEFGNPGEKAPENQQSLQEYV